jgi:uncharacterized protein (DUF1800 family)
MNEEKARPTDGRFRMALAAAAAAVALTACGGGSGGSATSPSPSQPPPAVMPTSSEAARFLTQSTFGPTDESIERVRSVGYSGWIDEQFALAASPHLAYVRANYDPAISGTNFNWLQDSFWQQAIAAPDQLRQRVKFALSQILVVSAENGTIAGMADGHASYVDLLGEHAFGNYRQLLEAVATHPAMGIYLTHLRNRKGDPVTGRVPDENFAREVMQLFSIGLLELNQDGTPRLVNGAPVETYTNADTSGIARVFTGWSWAAPTTSDQAFNGTASANYPDRNVRPMQAYPQFHETGAKTFLGVTIPANTSAQASMKIAMDTLFDHPNLCPFIGRQLIQRLVTSNPGYVSRVAAACANNGSGVRGDMKAIVRAVLLDADARDAGKLTDPQWGKVREPVLRLSNWARCFGATSASGNWTIRGLDSPSTSLGQQPFRAPSVFNYYRPGYAPPNTAIATAGLVAPEFQIVGETSVVGYVNFMQGVISTGAGVAVNGVRDVRASYAAEQAIADNADALIDRIDRCLTNGSMPAVTRQEIRNAVNAISLTATNGRANRVYTAILLTMASPDYLVQK